MVLRPYNLTYLIFFSLFLVSLLLLDIFPRLIHPNAFFYHPSRSHLSVSLSFILVVSQRHICSFILFSLALFRLTRRARCPRVHMYIVYAGLRLLKKTNEKTHEEK